MLKKILIPLDGSPLSDRILIQVRRLLLRQDAEVTLLRVLPTATRGEAEWLVKEGQEAANREMRERCDRLRAEGATASFATRSGDPASEILRFAAETQPSLLAMSTHARTGLDRWMWGSVAERVLRGSTHPLLLANPMGLDPSSTSDDPRFRRILVPLDGSEQSAAVLPYVEDIARLYESEIVLLHCATVAVPSLNYPDVPVLPSKADGEELLNPVRSRMEGNGLRTQLEVLFEHPAAGILDMADKVKADLVAMTTHGRSGLSRWAFGSVAEKVVRHCPCPVLAVRTTGFDESAARSPES